MVISNSADQPRTETPIMLFTSWLRKLTLTRNPKPRMDRCATATFRPRLEALEDRCVPSTLKVTNTADSGPGSLRYEIAQANSGDTIVFDPKLSRQTITLTGGELVISKSLTINGQGETIASQPYQNGIFEPVNGSRIFEVDGAGTTVALSGLTLTNGGGTRYGFGATGYPYDGYGGAILNFGTLTVSGCTLGGSTLNGNEAQNSGGAIANFGALTVSGCYVSGNTASGVTFIRSNDGGGGIYNAGTLTVSGSHVVDNSAGTGGGIYNAGTMTVSGSYVQNNSAHTTAVGVVAEGGGIFNAAFGTLTLKDSTVLNNVAPSGADVYNLGALTLDDSDVGVIGP
jgi:hypothetical protein